MGDDEDGPNGWVIRWYPEGEVGGVAFNCPGCGSDCYIPIKSDTGWTWDGNVESPTLRPSLGQRCCGWHGYLTAGRFVAC
jgi:hypothetical protein